MKIQFLFVKPIFKILDFIFHNPTKEFYEKEISKKTKISIGACNKYMKELVRIEFLHKEKRGKMNFYRLNREDILVKQLKIVFTLSSPIVTAIKGLTCERTEVFLYGSFARGEDVEDSDFDILLISPRKKHSELSSMLRSIGEMYEKKMRVMSFTRDDWIGMRKKDPAFYERVERDKIRLV